MNENEIKDEIFRNVRAYARERFGAGEPFIPGQTPVHYAGRYFDDREIVNLVDSALDFWLTEGRHAEQFAGKIEDFLGVSEAILTNSGSSANLLAVSALTSEKLGARSLKPGDEVITVAAGFPSTIAPIVQNGLVPVFLDVDPETYNIRADLLEEALSPRTKAIMLAHTLGNPFDLDAVMKIVEDRGLFLIEDNCDALGSAYRGKRTGAFGHLSTISFYPAHQISTGEGGCVCTQDPDLAQIVRSFRDWGRDCYCGSGESNTCGKRFGHQYGRLPAGYDHKYVYSHIGYNLKMTDMQAAIGSAQMDKIATIMELRKANFTLLYDGLKDLQNHLLLPRPTPHSDPCWFSFILTVRPSDRFSRDALVGHLNSRRIETRNIFAGNILRQPGFLAIPHRVAGDLSHTDDIMTRSFFIGVHPILSREKIDYMIQSVREYFLGLSG